MRGPMFSPAVRQHLRDYDRYLDSRWRGRLRALGWLGFALFPLVMVSDRVIGSLQGAPPTWERLALLRLPWAVVPPLAMGLYRLPARLRPPLALLLCTAFYTGTDWAFLQLGRGFGVRHVLVLSVIALACLSYIPLRRGGRVGLIALFSVGHLLVDLLGGPERALAFKLWDALGLTLGLAAKGFLVDNFFRAHQRSFLLRAESQEALRALEASRGQVTGAVSTLAGSVAQLTQGAQELAQGSAASREASQQMVAAAESMARSAHALQERSRGGALTAAEAHAHTQAVQQLLSGVEAGVGDIEAAVARSEASFRRLQAHAERIGRFVDSVQEMAAQTQMLAVNAGIEASRSGAQGAGFAVIAQEVRGLAQASASSSRDVGSVVLELQRQVDGTVTSVEGVRERTRHFLSLYAQTRETLGAVLGSVAQTEGAMRLNAQDAVAQAQSTEAISDSTAQLLRRVEAQALLAQRVTDTSQQLHRLATGLRALLPEGEGERPGARSR